MAKEKTKSVKEKPAWIELTEKDVEAIVVKLAKQGLTSEKIGLELRDKYGVPRTRVLGKRVSQILKENDLYSDSTEDNLVKKREKISQHLKENKQDKRAMRSFTIIKARLAKYAKYKKRKDAEPNQGSSKRLSKRKRK